MKKFQAPEHVTAVFAGGLEIRADEDGVAEVPEDAGAHVIQAMLANGWTPLADDAAAKTAAKPAGKPAGQSDGPAPSSAN
jgi:hypothetical protein